MANSAFVSIYRHRTSDHELVMTHQNNDPLLAKSLSCYPNLLSVIQSFWTRKLFTKATSLICGSRPRRSHNKAKARKNLQWHKSARSKNSDTGDCKPIFLASSFDDVINFRTSFMPQVWRFVVWAMLINYVFVHLCPERCEWEFKMIAFTRVEGREIKKIPGRSQSRPSQSLQTCSK